MNLQLTIYPMPATSHYFQDSNYTTAATMDRLWFRWRGDDGTHPTILSQEATGITDSWHMPALHIFSTPIQFEL